MRAPWVPILCYHRVCPESEFGPDSRSLCVTPKQFARQMRFLKALRRTTITLQNLSAALRGQKNLPPRPVAITFDDGYADNHRYAFPVLQELGFTATVFLVTGQLGGRNVWDSGQVELLSERQIEAMQAGGIVFGSHSETHLDLSQAPADQARRELELSRQNLIALTARTDIPFCYPYSRFTEGSKRAVREVGYDCAVAVDSGPRKQGEDLFELRRIQVFPSTSLFGFWKKIQPWYPDWLRFQQKLKGKSADIR